MSGRKTIYVNLEQNRCKRQGRKKIQIVLKFKLSVGTALKTGIYSITARILTDKYCQELVGVREEGAEDGVRCMIC